MTNTSPTLYCICWVTVLSMSKRLKSSIAVFVFEQLDLIFSLRVGNTCVTYDLEPVIILLFNVTCTLAFPNLLLSLVPSGCTVKLNGMLQALCSLNVVLMNVITSIVPEMLFILIWCRLWSSAFLKKCEVQSQRSIVALMKTFAAFVEKNTACSRNGKKSQKPELYNKYKDLRNSLCNQLKFAKQNFFSSLLDNESPSKRF